MTRAIERRHTRTAALLLAALLALSSAPASRALGDLVSLVLTGPSIEHVTGAVTGAGGVVDAELPLIDGAVARVPAGRIGALPSSITVIPDRIVRLQSQSFEGANGVSTTEPDAREADALVSTPLSEEGTYAANLQSAYPHEVGATNQWYAGNAGSGVTVALVDTGITNSADFAGRIRANLNLSRERSRWDTYGHGTFMAGLMAGNGASSGGKWVGVAPEAGIMAVKVANREGTTSLGQVLAGVQAVVTQAARLNVRVLLLAVDSESPYPPEIDPLSQALRAAWAAGIVVVVPAGNDGDGPGTIATPGEDPVLLTSGSVDDHATATVEDDTVSAFTGVGPTRWGDEKPDLSAPGEHVVSVRAPGSYIDENYSQARVDDAYFRGSGTSMSAAITAGAAALLLAARPSVSATAAKAMLVAGAAPIPDGEADTTGSGVVDAHASAGLDEPDLGPDPDEKPPTPGAPPEDPSEYGAWHKQYRHEARQWAARQWKARQWAARQWAARQWQARQWQARQWKDDAWAARQWAARQWQEDDWQARQWKARQWTARQWKQATWEARQWKARQWSARQWSARQWSARQWNARQWSANAWT